MMGESVQQSIARQWKSRSLLLLDHFYKDKAAPAAPGSSIKHSGPVRQLSGRGLLQSWKKRHCVLDGQRLFFYQPASAATTTTTPLDKTSHYIDLSSYDICEEAAIGHKDVVRRCSSPSQAAAAAAGHQQQHVLVISSADIEKGSHRFFDTSRIYLSAESATEMNEWISQIRSVMTALRSGSGVTVKKTTTTTATPRNGAKSIDTVAQQQQQVNKKEEQQQKNVVDSTDVDPLDCAAVKERVKGPAGRRLPRQVNRVYAANEQRSESLSRLELNHQEAHHHHHAHRPTSQHGKRQELMDRQQHNRSFDFGRPARKSSASTVYAYSSSDEDEQSVMSLSFGQQPTAATATDEEAVIETLCSDTEPVLPHATSTPILAHPSQQQHHYWESHSMPRRPKRRMMPSSSNTDDDPPAPSTTTVIQQQQHLLMQQTAAIRATLAGLETDLGASRRDVGWLQENLTTVQSAAGQVADKVGKMQSTVANMERQINGAVKEAQQMQQRANEALKSAADAERDFRRLESDCRELLNQLRRAHQSSGTNQDALSISPMTPYGLMIQQPKSKAENNYFVHPPAFDFASILAGSAKPAKSSLRCSESRSITGNGTNKTISFGPTTTFATSPTTEHEDDVIGLIGPVATSTLKRTVSPFLKSAEFMTQNSASAIHCSTP